MRPQAVRALHAALEGRIACASGADRHKVELQLDKIGLLDCFEGRIFSGHEMPRSKPAPDVYLAAAAALGVDPARCAVVEDTVTGATAGVAAGATVFGYSPTDLGHSGPDALRAVGVAQVFTDMAQLPALLAARRSLSEPEKQPQLLRCMAALAIAASGTVMACARADQKRAISLSAFSSTAGWMRERPEVAANSIRAAYSEVSVSGICMPRS